MDESSFDVKAYPRILELLLLNFDATKFELFANECCTDDCELKMRIKHQSSTSSLPGGDNRMQQLLIRKHEIVKYMSLLYESIPDAVFLMHYHQVQNKGNQGSTIFCKFTITGMLICDLFAAKQQQQQQQEEQQNAATNTESDTNTTSSSSTQSEPAEPWLDIKLRRNVKFAGNINSRNNDAVKRKYSTVGRYIDVSDFEQDFQQAQLFIQEKPTTPKRKKKVRPDHRDLRLAGESYCQLNSAAARLSGSTDSESSSIYEDSPLSLSHSDESPQGLPLSSLNLSNDSYPSDSCPQIDLLDLFAFCNLDFATSSSTSDEVNNHSNQQTNSSNVNANINAYDSILNEIKYSLPPLLPIPKDINGVGILKLHVNPAKQIYKVECSIQLC